MQGFAEFIAESYESHVELIWNLANLHHLTASFTVGSMQVEVSFDAPEDADEWRISFETGGTATSSEGVLTAFDVFNGVFQAVREFIEVREPETLIFATKTDKLANIYQTYLRREASALEQLGYEVEGPVRIEPFMEFILRRKRASNWRNS